MGFIAAMDEVMETVSAEEMLCSLTEATIFHHDTVAGGSSRTGVNN
jgi:hypothetical protein